MKKYSIFTLILMFILINEIDVQACFKKPKQNFHYFKFHSGGHSCPNFNNIVVDIFQYEYSYSSHLKKSVANGIKLSNRGVNQQDIKIATQYASSIQFQKEHDLIMYRVRWKCDIGPNQFIVDKLLKYSDMEETTSTFYIEVPRACCNVTS